MTWVFGLWKACFGDFGTGIDGRAAADLADSVAGCIFDDLHGSLQAVHLSRPLWSDTKVRQTGECR